MDTTQKMAVAGIAGAACFGAALLMGDANSQSPVAEALFVTGFAGFAAITASLVMARAGGSRFGQVALWIWLVGNTVLLVAGIVSAVTGSDDNAVFPIGGLLTALGGLLAAVPVARAGALTGWRRFAPGALAAFYLVFLVVNVVGINAFNQWTLLAWPALAILTGVAVITERATERHPASARAVHA